MLTIVMYRFVRDLPHTRFPRIKGISLQDFRGQLEYLRRRHTVVSMEEVMYAAQGSPADLPSDAALLTFDDGLLDHYTHVLPLLDERGWQGTFFAAATPVLQRKIIDTHKIQFLLAAIEDVSLLLDELARALEDYRDSFDLSPIEEYWSRLAQPARGRPAESAFFQRMLGCELPAPVRQEICERLFARHVTADEAAFAAELYLSLDQLRLMQRLGMHIGGQGETGCRLDGLGPEEREREIRASLELLEAVGADIDAWSIAYPQGAHDDALRSILQSSGAKIGVTREPVRADLWRHGPLVLPRLDTHDLPKQHSVARLPIMVGGAHS